MCNKSDFEIFKESRTRWIETLVGKDCHSVKNQIIRMLWDAAIFRIVNEARKFAPPVDANEKDGDVKINAEMHALINRNFFITQALSIRRLMDEESTEGKFGVYSLVFLLKEMKKNTRLFTRKHLFDAEDLLYDYEPSKNNFMKQLLSNSKLTNYGWRDSERRHENIDILSNIDKSRRSSEDSISESVFACLIEKLSVCKKVKFYVDKFIAHSSTPASRSVLNKSEVSLTLGKIWDAHKSIYEITNFTSIYLLGGNGLGGLPVPQFDQYKFLDTPLIEPENICNLEKAWIEFDREVCNWGNWGIEGLDKEFSK